LISNAGGESALVEYIAENKGLLRKPGIVSLGNIAYFDETLAIGIIAAKGIPPLKDALLNE